MKNQNAIKQNAKMRKALEKILLIIDDYHNMDQGRGTGSPYSTISSIKREAKQSL